MILVFALALLGIAYAQSTRPSLPNPQLQTAANGGRFQIVMSAVTARNTFLLDTQTGKVWQLTQFSDLEDDPTAWMIQTRVGSDLDLTRFALSHKPKKQP